MASIPPELFSASTLQGHSGAFLADQCDCACPDAVPVSLERMISSDGSLRCAEVYAQPLPLGHSLLFNPRCATGLAVLNASAKQVWEGYRSAPVESQGESGREAPDSLLQQMIAHGLLEAAGRPPTEMRWGPPRTLGAWLHITNACNLHCDYCYLGRSDDAMSEAMGRAAIDALIRSAVRGGFERIKVKYAGGEPSLRLPLVYALQAYAGQAAHKAGLALDAVLLTNGIGLGEKALTGLKSRGIRITVSLDGIGKWQDQQRRYAHGQGSYAEVKRTLDRLAACSITPFISITITRRNAAGLPELVGFLLDRGLPFNFNLFRGNDHVRACDLTPDNDQVIEALEQALSVIESRLPSYSLLGSLLDRCALDRPHERTCGVGESYLVFDPRGRVAGCHMTIDCPVTDVYSHDPLADIRQASLGVQNPSVEAKEGCRSCNWKYWCAGGCPLVTYRAFGRYDVKSPYCRIYQTIIPRILHLEGLRVMRLAGLPV